jgi:hypothetical protein
MPYYHWVYQGELPANQPVYDPLASYQNGGFYLYDYDLEVASDQLLASFDWYTDGSAAGDYVFFLHLYDDTAQPPIAQAVDQRPGDGTLAPGNWLAGSFFDQTVVDLTGVPAGQYRVAIGFYRPETSERLMPVSMAERLQVDEAGRRLFIGEVEILGDG